MRGNGEEWLKRSAFLAFLLQAPALRATAPALCQAAKPDFTGMKAAGRGTKSVSFRRDAVKEADESRENIFGSAAVFRIL